MQLHERYKDQGLTVVSIANQEPDTLAAFAKDKGAGFPLLVDPDGSVFQKYEAQNIPNNFLLDSEGRITAHLEGFGPEEFERKIVRNIEKMLGEGSREEAGR